MDVVEAKIAYIEEELNDISALHDLKRLEDFIRHYTGSILHRNHYLVLLAKRNYLFISRKQLIDLLAARGRAGRQDEERRAREIRSLHFRKKSEMYRGGDFLWILETLHCEESF